jgi:hypothetical protein
MTYFTNIRAWLTGFRRFDELTFEAGWSADSLRWWLLYAIDYGSHVLTGGAVVSWSRWFYDNREKYRVANFFDRLLNHFEDGHGRSAGPALWGTVDCSWRVRMVATAAILLMVLQ